jgi:hypothetical protein
MLRTFIFDDSESHWIEEESNILAHDVSAILDEENEIIYLWEGPKSKKEKFRNGYKQIKELVSNFPELNIQFVMSKRNFPIEIQNKIATIFESGKGKILKFSRFSTIRFYSISIIINVILPITLFLNLSTSLFWSKINNNYQVNNVTYANWINNSKIITLILLIFLSINLLIGLIEYENQVIIFSLNGIIISIGLLLYLNQGTFLFLFQEGWTPTNYLILQNNILIFLVLILTAILIFEIPNIYKLISFFKTYRKFIL